MINQEMLAHFDTQKILINAGRGEVIAEKALINALHNKQLGYAILDVTQQEPLSQDNPLWDCPNLLLTQHSAGGSTVEDINKIQNYLINIKNYINNKKLNNVIDWEKGF